MSEIAEEDSSSGLYGEYLAKAADMLDEGEEISYARFFDISILDKDGKEVEIAAPVEVEITLADKTGASGADRANGGDDGDNGNNGQGDAALPAYGSTAGGADTDTGSMDRDTSIGSVSAEGGASSDAVSMGSDADGISDGSAAEKTQVIHFESLSGEEVPEVLDGVVENGDTVGFTAESFSVYAVIMTESITTKVITAAGEAYEISVYYGPEARIPENAQLEASEILQDDAAYAGYVAKAEQALGIENGRLPYVRLFDISILDSQKNAVEIAAPVQVGIRLAGKMDNLNTQIVHFGNTSEILQASADGERVSFETAGFSVYAAIDPTVGYTEKTWEKDGDGGYAITVKYLASEDGIPKDADLQVEEVAGEGYEALIKDALGEDARFKLPPVTIGLYEGDELKQPATGSRIYINIKSGKFYAGEEVRIYDLGEDDASAQDSSVQATVSAEKIASFAADACGTFGVAVNDPASTFRVYNILDHAMYTGVQGETEIKETVQLHLSDYGGTVTLASLDEELNEDYWVVALRNVPSGKTVYRMNGATMQYKSGNSYANSTTVNAFRLADGKLQYRVSGTWTDAGETVLCVIPREKLVKFDPNLTDMSKTSVQSFLGAWSDNAGHSGEGEFYVLYSIDKKTGLSASYTYTVKDRLTFPNAPTLPNETDTDKRYIIFQKWRAKTPTYEVHGGTFIGYSTQKALSANSSDVVIYARDDSTNYQYQPLVVAFYDVRSINGKVDHMLPAYPTVETVDGQKVLRYAPDEDNNPGGAVVASKKAQWASQSDGIGKITLDVGGVPVKKGADVVLVLDISGSMSNRYNQNYPEREPYEKEAAMMVIDELLKKPEDNNRVAFVTFCGQTGPYVPLQTTEGIENLKTAVNGMLADGQNTNYSVGLQKAIDFFNASNTGEEADKQRWPTRPRYVIFISDGAPGDLAAAKTKASTLRNKETGYGATIYTVGIEVSTSVNNTYLKPLTGDKAEQAIRLQSVTQLTDVIQDIASNISLAAYGAKFNDEMSEFFDAMTDDELSAYNAEHGTSYANSPNVISVSGNRQTVTVDVGDIGREVTPRNRKSYEFYIKVTNGMHEQVNEALRKTNTDISLSYYTDEGKTEDSSALLDNTGDKIGSPVLGRHANTVVVEYYRVDKDGNYLDEYGRPWTGSIENARLKSETFGIDLENAQSNYTVHYDTKEAEGYVDAENLSIYGKMPDGYELFPGESESKEVTVKFDDTEPPKVIFRLIAPYTVSKSIIGQQEGGYKAGEEIHYQIIVKSTARETMMNVRIIDRIITPNDVTGNEDKGAGTVRMVTTENLRANDDGSYSIESLEPNEPFTIEYYYRVAAEDIGKRVKNTAYVNGIATNDIFADTKGASVTKTASAYPSGQKGFRAGDVIKYSFTVKNIGTAPYEDIVITDIPEYSGTTESFAGKFVLQGQAGVSYSENEGGRAVTVSTSYVSTETGETVKGLGVGKTFTFTLLYTVQEGDIGKKIKNTAIVDGSRSEVTVNTEVLKLILRKTDMSGTGLSGGRFALYKADKETLVQGGLSAVKDGTRDGILVAAGSGGTYEFALPTGTYYLKEEEAPDGYNALPHLVKITAGAKIAAMADDALGGAQYPSEADKTKLVYTVSVTNSAGYVLPSTGGRGTWHYALAGLLLLATSVGLALRRQYQGRGSRG